MGESQYQRTVAKGPKVVRPRGVTVVKALRSVRKDQEQGDRGRWNTVRPVYRLGSVTKREWGDVGATNG